MTPHCQMDLTIMAAEGLKNVNLMRTKMAPFAVAYVDGYSKQSTRVLSKGGKDPVWNDSMQIPIPPNLLHDPSSALTIQVFNQGPISTSMIAATELPLQDLFRLTALKGNGEGDILSLQLFRPSGRAHGIIRIFVKLSGDEVPGLPHSLGDGIDAASYESEPVTGIPVLPTMGMQSAVAPRYAGHTAQKFSSPYVMPPFAQTAHMPYPTTPRSLKKRNNNFLFGLVSGAVAAVVLGALF